MLIAEGDIWGTWDFSFYFPKDLKIPIIKKDLKRKTKKESSKMGGTNQDKAVAGKARKRMSSLTGT